MSLHGCTCARNKVNLDAHVNYMGNSYACNPWTYFMVPQNSRGIAKLNDIPLSIEADILWTDGRLRAKVPAGIRYADMMHIKMKRRSKFPCPFSKAKINPTIDQNWNWVTEQLLSTFIALQVQRIQTQQLRKMSWRPSESERPRSTGWLTLCRISGYKRIWKRKRHSFQ